MHTSAFHDPALDLDALRALPELRPTTLDALVARLSDDPGHLLLYGPSGSGRGLLLRQLGSRVEATAGARWLVVRPGFRPVLRTSDLWVDVARRLSPASFTGELPVEEEARSRLALDVIDGKARVEGRRVLVLWENLDEDLLRLGDPNRAVREVLAGGHALTVVASAGAPLSTAGPAERGLAEQFSAMALDALGPAEAIALAEALSPGRPVEAATRLGAVTTLLGAWPAVVARWAEVAARGDAGSDLLGVLAIGAEARLRLLRELPAQARAVLEGLALQEGPCTAHELSAALGLDVNAVSSQLSRLGRSGLVEARRRPDSGRAAFVVRDRALALWCMARGPGQPRLVALARHLARPNGAEGGSLPALADLHDDLGRCTALVAQARADEVGAPLSRLLEQAVASGLGWAAIEAALWPLVQAAARQGSGVVVADQLEESAFSTDAWLLITALRGGAVHRLLPEAQGPVLALQTALGA